MYRSDLEGVYPISLISPAKFSLTAAPDGVNPYSAILTTIMLTCYDPYSGLATVQISSLHLAVR